MSTIQVFYTAAVFISSIMYTYGDPPMKVTSFGMCENKTYLYQYKNIKLRIKDDAQEVKMKIIMSKDLNDDNYFVVTVDRYLGNKMKKLINMKNKGPCSALITYGGDTFMGGVEQAKFPHPDRCPFEKGTYTLDWYKINFDAIPLVKLVPKGKFMLTVQVIDANTGKDQACFIIVIDKN